MFISVTRLHVKGKRKLPSFFWHTYKSIIQSKKAKGLLHSSFEKEGRETFWTLTVWESKDDMKKYRNNGNHLKAMKISRNIADELQYINWEGDQNPSWKECMERLHKKYGQDTISS
ncbi:DUF3291 domain-containing protein [Salinibacillus xinjiangensis]|uniref:DUF3291 domain-containing protein n=1 Tax=Salinibacillus xinjiangensis TaxID=1229268 RepID=A0A6G1X853_9BACI|nr:DUF3291 domain-containing protein [Salinibacillus xinjiangensis]MRG87183.1 DUF3291 domain-containing protein [Salinibacillus xinjiangensis]